MKIGWVAMGMWLALVPAAMAETAQEKLDRAYQYTSEDNLAAARPLFGQACDAGLADACIEFASALRYDPESPDTAGADRAISRARSLLSAACDTGTLEACFSLETLLRYDDAIFDPAGAEAAAQKAHALQESLCIAGEFETCMSLADAILYSSTEYGGEDSLNGAGYQKIETFLKQARAGALSGCNNVADKACWTLGTMEMYGWGGSKSAAGLVRLDNACFAGDESACWNRIGLLGDASVTIARDRASVLAFVQTACAANTDAGFCSPIDGGGIEPVLAQFEGAAGLDLAAATASCDAGRSASACSLAAGAYAGGLRYKAGSKAVHDRLNRQANRLRCNAGPDTACYDYASDLLFGHNGPAEVAQALPLFVKICQSEPQDGDTYTIIDACLQAANESVAAAPPSADGSLPANATAYYQRACDSGDEPACQILDPNYVISGDEMSAMAPEASAEAWAPEPLTPEEQIQLCHLAIEKVCSDHGIAPPDSYEPVDAAIARMAFTRGCDNDYAEACTIQARLMVDGDGGPKDGPGGTLIFERACALGDGNACGDGGVVLLAGGAGITVDPSRAWALFNAGCSRGEGYSCWQAGEISLSNDGCGTRHRSAQGCLPNYPEARQFFARGCDLGGLDACGALGFMFDHGLPPTGEIIAVTDPATGNTVAATAPGVSADLRQAETAYRRSCPLSDDKASPAGCNLLGLFYGEGAAGKGRGEEALSYFIRACELENAVACRNAGIFFRDGVQGVRKNKKTAQTWFEAGCKLGDENSCFVSR